MITLKVGLLPGTLFDDAIVEVRDLARRLNVFVEYDFNDRGAVLVGPDDFRRIGVGRRLGSDTSVPPPPSTAVDLISHLLKGFELTDDEANRIVAITRMRARSSKIG